jgi:hypothetical protein
VRPCRFQTARVVCTSPPVEADTAKSANIWGLVRRDACGSEPHPWRQRENSPDPRWMSSSQAHLTATFHGPRPIPQDRSWLCGETRPDEADSNFVCGCVRRTMSVAMVLRLEARRLDVLAPFGT